MLDKFPILAWPIGPIQEKTIEEVKLWKEVGLTANISPRWYPESQDKELMLRLLDECQKYDIKLIVHDMRTLWNGAAGDPEGYRTRFRAAYADFGKHPATLGFYIGDEPMKADMPDVITASRIQMEEAPELLPYFNLFPIWPDSNPPYLGYGDLDSYVQELKENVPTKVVSYDRYTQTWDTDAGREIYFHDMRVYHEIAKAKGLPLWTCLLSAAHWAYLTPNEDMFRWQLNTALAGGCTGIIWFTLNEVDGSNYRDAPIDKFGEKSLAFYYLSRVCRQFLASTADIFKDLTLDACYHVGKAWGGWPLFQKGVSDKLLNVQTITSGGDWKVTDSDLIVSFYTHKNGDQYLAVVNNSPKVNNLNFFLTFNRDTCNPVEIRTNGRQISVFDTYKNKEAHDFDPNRKDTGADAKQNKFSINLWACAGQMYLFKL